MSSTTTGNVSASAKKFTTYNIRPPFNRKLKSAAVKECIHSILLEELSGKSYSASNVPIWTSEIAEHIQNKVKELGYERYKFVTHVIIGEQRGEGVKAVTRCLWDADTDNCVSDVLMNESMFCVATVYGTYYY